MNEVLLIIGVLCKLNVTNVTMPKDEKIMCIEHFSNCLIGSNGKYLKDELKNCERKYENIKRNNGGNNEG